MFNDPQKMSIRSLIIFALLFTSYLLYIGYTHNAIQMIETEKLIASFILHPLLFLAMGITLGFDTKLISHIKKKETRVNPVNLCLSVITLLFFIMLVILRLFVYMYISCFIAFLMGFFLAKSMEGPASVGKK